MTLGPWLAQVHTYPVGGYVEQLVRLSSCGHTSSWSSVQDPRVALSLWLAQVVHFYPVATGPISRHQSTTVQLPFCLHSRMLYKSMVSLMSENGCRWGECFGISLHTEMRDIDCNSAMVGRSVHN